MSEENWFDADIDALQLGWGEKAGLQIYRNYTRSFEQHAIIKFREALNHEKLELDEFTEFTGLLVHEDLRFLPIILCAFADEVLEEAFKHAIPDNVPGGKTNLFGAYG